MQKEINKLLKNLEAEKLRKNHNKCIELYNIIGGLHSEINEYDDAAHYHEKALELCKTIGDCRGTAQAFRYIGEAKAALSNFYQAIDYVKKYLELAKKLNDKVELQRAWTTLGRVYLMQAQEMKDKSTGSISTKKKITEIAREAEKRFQIALSLAEHVRDQVDVKEYAQMTSGLLINLALIKDLCDQHSEAVSKLKRAIDTCRGAKLKEDLFRCQIILTGLFRQKELTPKNVELAVKTSEEALQTAKSIGKKILICDALIERGMVRICQRDFKNAKRAFSLAYSEKSPIEDDHTKAIRLTKLSHLISVAYEKLCKDTTAGESRVNLCDKLGDLFVAVGIYKLAVEYYVLALRAAKVCSRPKSELARILYSMAETYADDGQFDRALACYKSELNCRKGNVPEECSSLIKIAQMHEYLDHEPEKVCEHYETALEKADKDPKLIYSVLEHYVPYMKDNSYNRTRCSELEKLLENVKSYPEVEDEIETEDIADEIANVDDIISDDEDNNEVLMIGRRKAKGANRFKQNEVGDTPLHEACINGDFKRVKSLIGQGHEVNPRDHAGWTPLHEVCNHGHLEIAQYLIEHKADVNSRGLKGVSPLHDAATNGHLKIMELLIENGANVLSRTDTGETVLGCLRDYESRNRKRMSNEELNEYRAMVAKLKDSMDKSGFDFSTDTRSVSGAGSMRSTESALLLPKKPSHTALSKTTSAMAAPVTSFKSSEREYRDAINTLKRKRPLDVSQPSKKASQPATVQTNMSTSVSTKQWLLDDDVIEEIDDEDDDNDTFGETKDGADDDIIEIDKDDPVILDDDNDDVLFGNSNTPSPLPEVSVEKVERVDSVSLGSLNFSSNSASNFELFNQPLMVTIEDRKLMIPIKDEYTTIGELKELIIDRYSILVKAKAKISLAPKSDTSCFLFDADLCKDVVRESLVATIESWQLESIRDTYMAECLKYNLEPIDFVKIEMSGLDETGTKLDLSHRRYPVAHRPAIINSLFRRAFTSANFQGSIGLFEKCSQTFLSGTSTACPQTTNILDAIITWNKLTRLNLRCIGLLRSDFEHMCNIKFKLSELQYLDVGFNSISYKHKQDFSSQIEKLRQVCPKLKRLDVRKNHLQFVKSILGELQCSTESTDVVGGDKSRTLTNDRDSDTSNGIDISKQLNLSDIEVLGNDQCDYSTYSMN